MYWAQTVARKSVRLLILLALCVSSAGMATQSAHAALPVKPGASVAQGEGDPTITIGGALGAFASFAGAPSDEQSYTVAGVDLTDPIVVAPPADFQISLTSGSGWVSHPDTINLSPTDGTVVSTTIYVRFNRATIGSSSGDITHTSAGAVATNMPVSGAASNAAPLITEGDSIGVVMSEDSEPTAFSLTLNATDANPADTLTWSILTAATNGVANASGTGAFKAIGYTPTPDYRGNDSFVVQVSDDNGGSDTITVNVTIDPINDPPILDPIGDQSINELETLTLTFTGSDPDQPIDKLAFCSSGGPAGSSLIPDTGVFA